MQKPFHVVCPTTQGVALFLAHGTSTEGRRKSMKKLDDMGKSIIASDAVAEVLIREGLKRVIPLSKFGVCADLYPQIGMKPVLPEVVTIGMTADLADEGVVSLLKKAGIPIIDQVVIDPSFMADKRDGIMAKIKESLSVSLEEVIDSITPTVIAAVTNAVKGRRIVDMSEKSLGDTVNGIESGAFENEEFRYRYFCKVTELAWSKYIAKLTHYVGKGLEMIFSKKEVA